MAQLKDKVIASDDDRAIADLAFKGVKETFSRAWHSFDGDTDADKPLRYSKREREMIRLVISSLAADLVQLVSLGREKREALEARVAALEARDWAGVWEPGKAYAKGSIITHDGSAWVATHDYPDSKPGTPNSGWKLFVKRGRSAGKAKP